MQPRERADGNAHVLLPCLRVPNFARRALPGRDPHPFGSWLGLKHRLGSPRLEWPRQGRGKVAIYVSGR